MPTRNKQVKRKIRVDKIVQLGLNGRLKSSELSARGRVKDMRDASQVLLLSDSQSRWDSTLKKSVRKSSVKGKVTSHVVQWIPVISQIGKPLMPTRPKRIRELLEKGKAVGKWKVGVFYIQLTERDDGVVQKVAAGIDPGSKREAFTVKSEKHTYLNILSDAVSWVKDAVEVKRNMRKARRFRKTPCRKNRMNRSRGGIPPSTKARWNAKLRIVNILVKLFPISDIIVEDIQAKTMKNGRKWNWLFSPLEVGKEWFYGELRKLANLEIRRGYETKELRDTLGLTKTKGKMEEKFSAHNVDSWVLANSIVGGHAKPDNESIFRLIPLRFHRRQLYAFQQSKGNIRRPYGGTISQGLKRGSLVKHPKWGLCYVGGNMDGRGISLHRLEDGMRICQNVKVDDLANLSFNNWRWYKVA